MTIPNQSLGVDRNGYATRRANANGLENVVIPAARIGGGGRGGTTGFWGCFICTAACSILLGPEAVLECLIACKDSGACDDFHAVRALA